MDLFLDKAVSYKKLIFHGDSDVVKNPIIKNVGFTKDFGYGFYLTEIAQQAERWAKHKARVEGIPTVSVFQFDLTRAVNELRYLHFDSMSEEWLDFVVDCRSDKVHDWDIVEGPMADDTIYNYISQFLDGTISRDEFWILAKFRYATYQYVFNEKALSYINYVNSYEVRL